MRVHRSDMPTRPSEERGASLIEVMVALILLSIGILAVARLFPAGSHAELQSRMTSTASYYAQQKGEELMGLSSADPGFSVGRHPAGTATEALGTSGQWKRYYDISLLPAPLSSVRRVVVVVSWTYVGTHSVNDTLYLRR